MCIKTRLTDTGDRQRRKGKVYYKCICTCGNTHFVRKDHFETGGTKSCGCLRSELTSKRRKLPDGEASFNHLYAQYRRNAEAKGREFTLTKVKFKELITSDCYYCGSKPERRHKPKDSITSYFSNGIDRVDNTKGYIEGNVVACCKKCNWMKRELELDEFLNHVEKIWFYQDSLVGNNWAEVH